MSKPEPGPVVKGWDYMNDEEQVQHLMQSHGYRDGYFEHRDGTKWSDQETYDYLMSEVGDRQDQHEQDHLDYPFGEVNEHTHSLTHPSEVSAAIASIKETISARRG